ncbi:hypothetical protein [Solibacillus sp. CAU 1738]|uniref:hypothetical protein n=1 Tax=Solibacillus sp. CAU 1738 TaxID=3140363 RepID=UPI00326058EF
MNDNKWNEQDIESLLKQAPKIHDNRSKEDVFARLQADGVFDEEPLKKSRKKSSIYIGGITAAILACAIGIPLLNSNNEVEEQSADMASYSTEESSVGNRARDVENDASHENNAADNAMTMRANVMPSTSAIYANELVDNTLFTIGLLGDDTESIPAAILIPNEKILEDFGKENPTQVEMYNYYAPLLDEEGFAFNDYHPYKGEIIERGNTVVHILPEGHGYDVASGTMAQYTGSLIDTFKNYEKIKYEQQDGNPVTFSEAGEPSKLVKVEERLKFNYYLFNQRGINYLVPQIRSSFVDAKTAIEAMPDHLNDVFQSAIIDGINYEVEENETVHVTFTEPLDLASYDTERVLHMIEAILLTAANFNKQVVFENIVQTEWQGFNFNKPLPMPIAANEVPIEIIRNH